MTEHRLIGPGDHDYPTGLLDLEDPPTLYVIGATSALPAIGVVGTRTCTRYGVALAEAFGAALAKAGWITVSGLARGIDAAAHRGALDAGGEAVAVLGSGIDVVYPAENRVIYDRILGRQGAVMSEYPPGTRPDRWRFPARNRIIAAIASAVVVVEAGAKGGALITARLAAELGRPVFAVPGDVVRPASVGCNLLIRDGAHPALGPGDLVTEIELALGVPARSTPESQPIPATGWPLDDLPAIWGCTPAEALARLTMLEMSGRIRREGDLILPAS
jgi:DNA processing protein